MPTVEIYSKDYCPFCQQAKALLSSKGVDYREYEITTDKLRQQEMHERSNRTSVPQVFINNHHIGGLDDLKHADHSGTLNELLGKESSATA